MILHNLISIENRRMELRSQGYEFITNKLEQIKQRYNIVSFNSWDIWELNNLGSSQYNEHCFYKERYIYSLFTAKTAVDKILSGYPITDLSFVNILTVPVCSFQPDDWYKLTALTPIEKYPIWAAEDVYNEYNLDILFWILNSTPLSYHIHILDRIIWELHLLNSNAATNHQCTLEYLQKYRELLQSNCIQISTTQQTEQEQIYSIPTNLTKKQLVALLGRLKDNGFIAPDQTEEDFLNAFNPNATKQGKIKWIKRGETAKGITKTAMVNFVYLMYPELYFDKDKYNIVAAVFDIEPTRSDLSRGKKSEFSNELQQIITY